MTTTEFYDVDAVRKHRLLEHIDRLKRTEGLESYRAIERVYEGVSASYLSQVACGQRKFTAKIAEKYERYFKLPKGYFSTLTPPPYPPHVDLVKWGRGVDYINGGVDGVITGNLHNVLQKNYVFAIKVVGGLLSPLAKHKDVLFIDYNISEGALVENDIALFEMDNTFIFRRLVLAPSGDKSYIDIFNPIQTASETAVYIGKIVAKLEYL